MYFDTRLRLIACLGALLAGLGCASSNTTTATATPSPDTAVAPAPVAKAEPKAAVELSDPGAPKLEPIYFDTDRALLRADARTTLKTYATAIEQHPEWGKVTVDGHCDERGSEEYNLALGDKRAAAVAQYLVDLGVSRTRLETRSYGEARPAVVGHDETAWSKNRRTELISQALDSARR